MCEREGLADRLGGDLAEREETALELEEVSESEIDLVPATGFFALSALELLSTVDASTPCGDDAPFRPGLTSRAATRTLALTLTLALAMAMVALAMGSSSHG